MQKEKWRIFFDPQDGEAWFLPLDNFTIQMEWKRLNRKRISKNIELP